MFARSSVTDPRGSSSFSRLMDTVRRSVGGAMLTESQQHSLDTLRAEAEQLARFGRRDEALRTLRLAMSIIAAGPPALE